MGVLSCDHALQDRLSDVLFIQISSNKADSVLPDLPPLFLAWLNLEDHVDTLKDDFLTNALNADHSFVSEEILVISHHVFLYKVIEQ